MSYKFNPFTGNLDEVISDCSKLNIPKIGDATFTKQCDFNKLFGSAGRATGGEITDAGSETINVAAGTGFIKATDSDTAKILSFDWAASNGIAITTDTIQYVYVKYNSGTPVIDITATETSIDLDTEFPLGKVINEGGTLHILFNPWWVTDGTTNIIERFQSEGHVIRDANVGGLGLSVTGTRSILVTAGQLWSRLNEFAIPAIDTNTPLVESHNAIFVADSAGKGLIFAPTGTPYSSLSAGDKIAVSGTGDNNGSYKIESVVNGNLITTTTAIAGTDGAEPTTVFYPTVEIYWRSGANAWTDADVYQYPITQYNRLSDNTLQTINNNWYFNWWVYAEADDKEISMVYPQAQYATAASAEAESPPSSIPVHISENAILIGRILCKQGVDAPIEVQSAFGTTFTASQAADHGNLAGLGDDDHPQYLLVEDENLSFLGLTDTPAAWSLSPKADSMLTQQAGASALAWSSTPSFLTMSLTNQDIPGTGTLNFPANSIVGITTGFNADGVLTITSEQNFGDNSVLVVSSIDGFSFTGGGSKIVYPGVDGTHDLGKTAYRWKDLYLSGNLTDGTNSVTIAHTKDAYDHVSNNGTDHSYIDQDVTSGATPTFTNTNFTAATDKNYVTDAQVTVIGNTSNTNTGDEPDATDSVKGIVELATITETDTGTDATRAVTPDGLQGSKRNIRWLTFNVIGPDTDCTADTNFGGDFVSPIAGTILQSDTTPFYLYATNSTAGTTGTMVVDVKINGTSIMTTNKLDFDTGEKTTTTASTPPDLTTTTLAVGNIITIDVASLHTTAAKGLTVYMAVREN
jgi:hypothetical protein